MTSTISPADRNALRHRVLEVLPESFDWCAIPGGEVKIVYGDWDRITPANLDGNRDYQVQGQRQFRVEAFCMAKFPLTVAQFEPFVANAGYHEVKFWTPEGWDWKQSHNVAEPRYWNSEKWHVADHPIVCITLHEALAYTQWLSHKTGLPITLPTEQQWQRAASGDDGRKYPWGNTFDPTSANTYENGIGRTTPVTQYPTGESPYGVMDMAGNVWEWTLPDENGATAVRGGSFNSEGAMAETSSRRAHGALSWDYSVGMRLVCAL